MEEKKLDLKVIKSSSDGRVTVSIGGKRYLYVVGGHQVNRFLELMKSRKKQPALDFLKKAAGDNFKKEEENLVDRVLSLWGD